MYVGVFFHLLKIGFVDTIKIILGASLIGTTFFINLWLFQVFKNRLAAMVGAVMLGKTHMKRVKEMSPPKNGRVSTATNSNKPVKAIHP